MAPITSFATLDRRMNSFSRMGCADHHPLTTHSFLQVPLQTSMIGEGYSTHLRTGEITKWNNTKIGLYVSNHTRMTLLKRLFRRISLKQSSDM